MDLNELHKGNWVKNISVESESEVKVTVESTGGKTVIYEVSRKPIFPDAFNNDSGETGK